MAPMNNASAPLPYTTVACGILKDPSLCPGCPACKPQPRSTARVAALIGEILPATLNGVR